MTRLNSGLQTLNRMYTLNKDQAYSDMDVGGNSMVSSSEVNIFARIIIGLSLLMLLGCNLAYHGLERDLDQAIKFSESGQGCISTALPNISLFFTAEASDKQLAQSWDCLSGAVNMFERYVRGSVDENSFTDQEFRAFLEKYFMGELKISDGLLASGMKIKQIFLGGSNTIITRAELIFLENFINKIKTETLELNPFMHAMILDKNTKMSPQDLEKLEAKLVTAAEHIGDILNNSQNSYEFSDIKDCLTEIAALFDQMGKHWSGPKYMNEHMNTLFTIKSLLVRPKGDSIAPTEWKELLVTGAKAYAIYLRYFYVLDPEPKLTTGYGLDQLVITVQKAQSILQESIDRKKEKYISLELLQQAVATVFDEGIITNPKIKKDTFVKLMNPIITKVYGPAYKSKRYISPGIDAKVLTMMSNDFFGWADVQKTYDIITANQKNPKMSLNMIDLTKEWQKIITPYSVQADEMIKIFTREYPLQLRQNGALLFEPHTEVIPVEQETLTSLNWRRLFVTVLSRAYTEDADQYHYTGISKAGFYDFYKDIRQFGIDMKFLDPRDQNIWNSLFIESHMFFLASDKSDRFNFQQGMDIISYAMTSSKFSSRAYNDMRTKCQNFELDVYQLPMLDVYCFRSQMYKNFGLYFQEMNHWIRAYQGWTQSQWDDFLVSLETVGRVKGNSNDHMESADLDKISMIMAFIESIYVRFDKDQNETISLEESMSFYPLVHDLLAEAAGTNSESNLEAVYTYIMKYGDAPSKSVLGLLKVFLWKLNKKNWQYELDRAQLVKILSALNSSVNMTVDPPAPMPIEIINPPVVTSASTLKTMGVPESMIKLVSTATEVISKSLPQEDQMSLMFSEFSKPEVLKSYLDQPEYRSELERLNLLPNQ